MVASGLAQAMNVFSDMDEFLEFKALMTDPDLLVSVKFAGTGFVVASLGDKANGYTVMCRALNFKEAVSWLR